MFLKTLFIIKLLAQKLILNFKVVFYNIVLYIYDKTEIFVIKTLCTKVIQSVLLDGAAKSYSGGPLSVQAGPEKRCWFYDQHLLSHYFWPIGCCWNHENSFTPVKTILYLSTSSLNLYLKYCLEISQNYFNKNKITVN